MSQHLRAQITDAVIYAGIFMGYRNAMIMIKHGHFEFFFFFFFNGILIS